MYCPSCDKSYGAVHSRCPECHSWLKMSAPAKSRVQSANSTSTKSNVGNVSTLDIEPISSWDEPSSLGATDWSAESTDKWSDALPSASTSSELLSDPSPVGDSGWGGGGWGTSGASIQEPAPPSKHAMPSLGSVSPVSDPTPAAPVTDSGWLGGDSEPAGWDSAIPKGSPISNGLAAPIAPKSGSVDGWGGGLSGATTPPAPVSKGLGASPSTGADDGWGGTSIGGSSPSPSLGAMPSSPGLSAGNGWLNGDDEGTASEPMGGSAGADAGWLGGSAGAAPTPSRVAPRESDGWLGGSDDTAPSMTEMVDRAIDVEEADDFVDDSWVDEEVNDGEFDDLEVPEYVPASPEVSGLFVKMLLVAVLVVLIGGGVMYMQQEQKTPEQIQAEKIAKERDFAESSIEMAKKNLAGGNPLLAIGPLEAAMESLKTTGAPQSEILETKALLGRALYKGQEYQKSYDHWASLAKLDKKYKKEARSLMTESSKQLRAQANADLTEAAGYIKSGESTSVLNLGRNALKIYQAHGGNASQKGRAYGVIGRGYFNGRDYANARENLKKAKALNPAGGYGADLNEIADLTAPASYHNSGGGGYQYQQQPAPTYSQPQVAAPSFVPDQPGYATSSGSYSHRPSSGGGSSSSAASAPQAAPRPTTKEIPTFRGGNSGSSGGRKGQQGVLKTY